MNCKSWKLSENRAIDIAWFNKIRKSTDGTTYLDIKINRDRFKGDHNPKTEISLEIFNVMVFEFTYYNPNHAKEEKVFETNRMLE